MCVEKFLSLYDEKKSIKALANVGIFLRIFLGISMENGAGWLEKRILMIVSGISLRVS